MLIEEICHARIGLMGNPSDGFGGKTVSFLIKNFFAKVLIEEHTHGIEIVENPSLDTPHRFAHISSLCQHVSQHGYYGVYRLILATCHVFGRLCIQKQVEHRIQQGFRLTYETNIPRMVGLSGSSAFIVATFRGLLRYYRLSIEELGISKSYLPQIILSIERDELNISAGLQDRVIQIYGGLVHMDFTEEQMKTSGTGAYTELDIDLLPPMYLAYNFKQGSDSGAAHSTVKERWNDRDVDLVIGMRRLASLADEAVNALRNRDYTSLAKLMEENFSIRRALYGDQVVGQNNIAAIELLDSLGFAAKFCGRYSTPLDSLMFS